MSEMKPTPGPWVVLRSAGDEWYFRDGEMTIARAGDEPDAIAVMDASAKTEEYFGIFAEALNMRDETGLTPRQLVERVKELEGIVRAGHSDIDGLPSGDLLAAANVLRNNGHTGLAERLESKHESESAALSKSLPNTVAETPSGQAPAAQGGAEDAALWRTLMNLPGARRRIWNHVLDDDAKGNANSIEEALRADLAQKEQSP